MTTQTIISPRTEAVIASSMLATFDSSAYANAVVFATNLAGAEEVPIFLGGGNVLVPATNAEGTALALTAAAPSTVLPAGPLYVFGKGATAGESGVYVAHGNI